MSSANKKINLFVGGVQKAGTTALAQFLSCHPDIFVLRGKEAHIFDSPEFPEHNNAAFISKAIGLRTQGYAQQKYLCDATPITCFSKRFIRRALQHSPHSKFIIIVRDPVERALSQYWMNMNNKQESRSISSAFWADIFSSYRALEKEDSSFTSSFRQTTYLKRGRYEKQLPELQKQMPAENLLILDHSALLKDHDQTMADIFGFLGINNITIKPKTVFKTTKGQRSLDEHFAKNLARLYFSLTGTSTYLKKIIQGQLKQVG